MGSQVQIGIPGGTRWVLGLDGQGLEIEKGHSEHRLFLHGQIGSKQMP